MMKTTTFALLLIAISLPAAAQPQRQKFMPRGSMMIPGAEAAEVAVQQAAEDLARVKKRVDADIDALTHIRAADKALTDPMQPSIAVERAYEEIEKAKPLDLYVRNGVVKCERELESARLSPTTADFGHLRAVIQDEALGPASRLVVREANGLSERIAAWIRVQQQISDHLRALSDTVAECIKAADQ